MFVVPKKKLKQVCRLADFIVDQKHKNRAGYNCVASWISDCMVMPRKRDMRLLGIDAYSLVQDDDTAKHACLFFNGFEYPVLQIRSNTLNHELIVPDVRAVYEQLIPRKVRPCS